MRRLCYCFDCVFQIPDWIVTTDVVEELVDYLLSDSQVPLPHSFLANVIAKQNLTCQSVGYMIRELVMNLDVRRSLQDCVVAVAIEVVVVKGILVEMLVEIRAKKNLED